MELGSTEIVRAQRVRPGLLLFHWTPRWNRNLVPVHRYSVNTSQCSFAVAVIRRLDALSRSRLFVAISSSLLAQISPGNGDSFSSSERSRRYCAKAAVKFFMRRVNRVRRRTPRDHVCIRISGAGPVSLPITRKLICNSYALGAR